MTHDEWVRTQLEAFSKAHGFIYTPLREIETRLGRLRKHMEELEIEGILAAEKMDCFYFSGTAQDALLFIPLEGDPLLLVKRELERAKVESPLDHPVKIDSLRDEISEIRRDCAARGVSLHDALMTRAGWPAIPLDGRLLVSHQDALLVAGKVQAAPGYADHVVLLYPEPCEGCRAKVCVEICSGEAIHLNTEHPGGVPAFDREKCVHCGVCLWNCDKSNISFCAAPGGLHSAEN